MKVKLKKKLKFIIPAVIIIVVVLGFFMRPTTGGAYVEEIAEKRDITTYRNFTGIIEAKSSMGIIPTVSANVTEVRVSEGDQVKEGDIIAVLDSTSVEQEIALKEASVKDSGVSSDYSVAEAKKAYEDYKTSIDSGLNSQLNQASSQINAAEISLNSANQNYANNEKNISDIQAEINAAKAELETMTKAVADQQRVIDSMTAADPNYGNTEAGIAEVAKLEQLKSTLNSKQPELATSIAGLENQMSSLVSQRSSLQLAVDSAQNSYNTAVSSYNETKLSVNQNLENYAIGAKKAEVLSDSSTTPLEMESLQDRLEDYTITAPMDGVITQLNLNVGEMIGATGAVATVTDFDGMKVSIKINEYDILGVETGKPVEITVSALEKTYEGTIASISKTATVENGVSYFTADINFDEDENIRSGMSVEVKLKNNEIKDAVTISMDALQYEDDNSAYVLLKGKEGEEIRQPVTPGITDGIYVEIIEGLTENDVVLIVPQYFMGAEMMIQTGDGGSGNPGQGGANEGR